MANTTNTPNMGLAVPVVGVDPGPTWGTDLNSCFTLIDQHDHSPGSGVQITPSGLNINSDLSYQSNNLTFVRSVRFAAQAAALAGASDLGCAYVAGVDLYFNDLNGNHIQITQSGGIAGSPGSIANLTSPATASYVAANQTFVWQSAVNTPANLDAASVILRNLVASSKGLTLSPPAAMGSNYTITLPALPGANGNILQSDTSGNLSAVLAVDNSTLEISSNTLRVKSSGITSTQIAANAVGTTQIADAAVTQAKRVALGQQLSSGSGTATYSGTTFTDVTGCSISITTTGRPVYLALVTIQTVAQPCLVVTTSTSVSTLGAAIAIHRSGTGIITSMAQSFVFSAASVNNSFSILPGSIAYIDTPAAGTYTYKIQANTSLSTVSLFFNGVKLIAYEL